MPFALGIDTAKKEDAERVEDPQHLEGYEIPGYDPALRVRAESYHKKLPQETERLGSNSTTPTLLYWRCACGKFRADLKGEPVFNSNCHCHSCVAPARYLGHRGRGGIGIVNRAFGVPPGTSPIVNGGVGNTFFMIKDIELPPIEEKGLKFFKVGEGDNIRSYTSCCGTLFCTGGGKHYPVSARPLTRSCIKNLNGSPYRPDDQPTECWIKHSFGDYKLPEPHFEGESPAHSVGIAKCAVRTTPDDANKLDERWFLSGQEVAESLPITWEGGEAAKKGAQTHAPTSTCDATLWHPSASGGTLSRPHLTP